MSNINDIQEKYQLNSILDIYGGNGNNAIGNAVQYYISHNNIKNGIVLSNVATPVNGMHKISNAYYYYENNDYGTTTNFNKPYSKFYPILLNNDNKFVENNYKLISSKDIDFENAYLKYANQTHDYNSEITYHILNIDDNGTIQANERQTYTYAFDRTITPYINNSYDLLNIVDYLFNRIKALNFLLDVIKDQRNVTANGSSTPL